MRDLDQFLTLFEQVISGSCSIENLRNRFKEYEHKLILEITQLLVDKDKFNNIANDIFINEIYPLLISNKFQDVEINYPINVILKNFPETRGILKKFTIILSNVKQDDYRLGSIMSETEELDRFKLSIFLYSLFDLLIPIEKQFGDVFDLDKGDYKPVVKFNNLSKDKKSEFTTDLIGVLIHELTHLIDYFRYTREEITSDFMKKYHLQDGEKRAIIQEFLYHFIAEDGIQRVKSTNDVEIFVEFVTTMNCWKFLSRIDTPENNEFLNEFLSNLYNYYKQDKNGFRRTKHESSDTISSYYHVTYAKDIESYRPSESTLKMISELFDK